MASITKSISWLYHEFGVNSVNETGRNAWFIILARTCRMFAGGANSLITAIFFNALNFTDHQIGLFMTLTLAGDVVLGAGVTLIADKTGRRRVLVAGSILMVISGIIFAVFENFWILLFAAVVGVISVTGGDVGPFRSIEESILSHLTTQQTRSDVLSWYVTLSTAGMCVGVEASGRIIHALESRPGWTNVDAYHALFWMYSAMGMANLILTLLLDKSCETQNLQNAYSAVAQEDDANIETPVEASHHNLETETMKLRDQSQSRFGRIVSWFKSSLTTISPSTRSVMYKLWFLLAVDSLADGMVPYALTNYFLDRKFHPAKSTLGDLNSVAYFLGAVTAVFAGPLARRLGLINTMVFTHVPSSAAVLLFPFPSVFWLAATLLLVRAGLNNMDQAPRAAFIAAVVKPAERTAVMGLTSMLRTFAATTGPTLTGVFAAGDRFWIAFVLAGLCRLAYDFGLYAMFVNMKLYEDETGPAPTGPGTADRVNNDSVDVELDAFSLDSDEESSTSDERAKRITESQSGLGSELKRAAQQERLRSRSPHKRMASGS